MVVAAVKAARRGVGKAVAAMAFPAEPARDQAAVARRAICPLPPARRLHHLGKPSTATISTEVLPAVQPACAAGKVKIQEQVVQGRVLVRMELTQDAAARTTSAVIRRERDSAGSSQPSWIASQLSLATGTSNLVAAIHSAVNLAASLAGWVRLTWVHGDRGCLSDSQS